MKGIRLLENVTIYTKMLTQSISQFSLNIVLNIHNISFKSNQIIVSEFWTPL